MKRTLLYLLLTFLAISLNGQDLNELLNPVKYRNIGPYRGGRSVCASGVPGDQLTYYMGTTGGGLWKTTDAGHIWTNISDGFFKTGSVGAVAVSESDPNVVYCGMGEHAPRGVMTSYGDGVYKSTDAGKTWKHMGLKGTQHIARILIHPKDPNLVYIAAQGPLHGNSEDRGIYKSKDGGQTWKKVLYVNDMTGCAELSMDMHNPNVLYAAMWEHQRKPWKVISGGAGSGLYKSVDGGETWDMIHDGLPEEKGKMAIAVSRSNPEKVVALIESDSNEEKGGLFVSQNGGKKWSKVSGDHRLIQRAWYYIEVFIDPLDEETLYVLSAPALRSIDGGKTWSRLTGTHGDFHDLWINPDNSRNLVIANDGGAAISFNYGETWSPQDNMPTAQFYRVSVDNVYPYRLYGGQQDNTSVRIDNMAIGRSALSRANWTYSAGGESAFLAYDPDNPRYVMGGSYLGTIEVVDQEAKASTGIMAAPIQYLGRAASDMKYRFDWNAPIIRSVHEPSTYYHASQYLLRTRDMGQTWQEVSPDLSKNEKDKQIKGGGPYTIEAVGAENYGVISYVEESQHEKGTIWVGTNDGLVQLTRDGGKNWKNVTPAGLEECLVNAIDVSPHDPGTAYIATTRYKFNDHTPGLYKTMDYGKTWTNISEGIPYGAYTRVVREDEEQKDLLFAGTETGMYISWNGGKTWQSINLNLPVVPITDLLIKEDDLVVATAGRSFWILDDLSLLRQWDSSTESFSLYRPEDAELGSWGSQLNNTNKDFKGTHPFRGVNPANGVVIYYYLPDTSKNQMLKMRILDSDGQVVNSFSSEKEYHQSYAGGPPAPAVLPREQGLNRFVWDMRYPTMKGVPTAYIEGNYRGHKAIPGTYTLILNDGTTDHRETFQIQNNPLYDIDQSQYVTYHKIMSQMERTLNDMHDLINENYKNQQQITKVLASLEGDELDAINKEGQELNKKLKAWDEDMVQRKSKAYDDVENFENKFTANYLFLLNQTQSSIPRVTQAVKDRKSELEKEWATLKKRGTALLEKEVSNYNKKLWKAGVGAIH